MAIITLLSNKQGLKKYTVCVLGSSSGVWGNGRKVRSIAGRDGFYIMGDTKKGIKIPHVGWQG